MTKAGIIQLIALVLGLGLGVGLGALYTLNLYYPFWNFPEPIKVKVG